MADAADGLDYAHSQGVIHRDVKPANLLLAKDGRIMIADFGLAKAVGEESVTVTGSLLGTVRYLSPEQAMAKRLPIDQRTDVYSLGATMYELLCHRPAFPGDHEQEVLAAIITRDPIPPGRLRHDIPDDLEVICLKAMEKAAGDRYPTAGAMKEDLERYLEDRPIVARRPGPLRRAEKFLRRRRAAVAATVAVFAILLLIPAGALVLGERNERLQAWAAGRIDKSLYYSARQQWTEAEVCLGEVLGWDPGHPRALERLAVLKKDIYNSQGIKDPALLEQAYDLCERALIREPQSASAWNTKGVIAKKLGRTSEAIHAYEQAVRFGSNSPAVLDNLAVIYALARRLNEAERILGDATKPAEGQPCNFGALCNMAALQLFRGDPVVVQTLERTIKCDPDPDREFVPPCLLSRLYQSATGFRHEEEGLIQARMADALAKGRVPYTKRVLAIAELKNGKWEESLRNAGKALEAGDLAVINQLVRAAALSELGLMQEAERAYRAAQEVWPDELKSEDGYTVSAELGVIWIDTAAECRQLEQHYFAKIGRPDSSDFR
jgi:Flp pilus assembly protein TadD